MIKVGKLFRERMVSSLNEGVGAKGTAFMVNFSGISGAQMNNLRKDLRRKKADVFVSRKSLASLALKNNKFEQLAESLDGQTAFIWVESDAAEVSKVLIKFAKDYKGFVIRGGILDGSAINPNDVKALSDLPPREVLLAQLLATIQSPISRLGGVLNGKTRELLSILKQYSEKKGGS